MKKQTFKRYLTYWLGILLSRGVPLATIIHVYGFFEPSTPTTTKVTGVGVLAVAVLGMLTFKDLKEWFQRLGSGTGNLWLKYAKVPAILSLAAGVLIFCYYSVANLLIISITGAVSGFLAIPFDVMHKKTLPELAYKKESEK